MPEKRKSCDLCQSTDLKIMYRNVIDYETDIKFKVDILKCNNCELIQQSELFSENEIENFYLKNYHGRNYNKQNNLIEKLTVFLRERYYQRFINLLISKRIDKQIKILDFGSGDGFLANQLIKNGYKNVFCCDFFKPIYEEASINYFHPSSIIDYVGNFDVVFMLNSIEHLVSFSKDFNAIFKTMNNGSLLILETPNIDSPDAYIFKKFWGGLHQPRHTYLWSKKSLIKHLSLWGFSSHNLGSPQSAHWAISVQNIFSFYSRHFKSMLNNGRFSGYLVLVIFFLPIGIFQNFLGKESVLNIFAILKKDKKIRK